MIVIHDHFIVTSEKVGFQGLQSKESSEILELVTRFRSFWQQGE